MKTCPFLRISGLLCSAAFISFGQQSDWKVLQKIVVPGDGGFDYIVFDGSAHRLYVSHGTKVDVFDAKDGKVIGSIADTPGVHGIAVVPELHKGFTTNGGNSTISMFDTETLKTVRKIEVGKDPDFTLYDPKTRRVLVCHGDAAAITEIDPATGKVAGKIDLGGGAEAAVVDGKGNGYVNLEEQAEVVHFDPAAQTVLHHWPITGCKTPTGLAEDTATDRLFIGCRSKVLAVMDAKSGKVLTTLPIGERVDAVAYDSRNKLVFASNGGGTVSVIQQKNADEYSKLPDIQTQPSAKTMAFDPKSNRIYLSAAEMEPAPSGQRPHPKPGSFRVLVVGHE